MSRLKIVDKLMNDPRNQTDDKGEPTRLIQCPYQAMLFGEAREIPCMVSETMEIPCDKCPTDDTAVFNKVLENLSHE